MLHSRSLLVIGLIISLLAVTTLSGSGQDGTPSPPASTDGGEVESGDAGEKADKNPLEDPVWQSRAKLGKMLARKRCVICHKIDGKGGVLSPPMEEVVAKRFKSMTTYDKHVEALKKTDPPRYQASKAKIDKIVDEKDRYQKLVLWLQSYLVKPTFDNGQAKMTPQILNKNEMNQIIAFVLSLEPKPEPPKDE